MTTYGVMRPTETEKRAPSSNGKVKVISTASRPTTLRQALAIGMEKLLWGRRAENWDEEGSLALTPVIEAVLESCEPGPDMVAVDLGCGSGQVTLPLAQTCSHVVAVDLSSRAIELLKEHASKQGMTNIHALTQPIERFDLGPESVDLVVSNYTLHHLRDRDKAQVVQFVFKWLRPGGRLVIGDIMMGRGTSPEDRAVIRDKLRSFAKRGPGGWWRILKNVWRFGLRFQEKPLPSVAWERIAHEAGFEQLNARRVVAEAWVVSAVKPAKPAGGQLPSAPSSSSTSASVGQVSTAL